MAVFTITLKPPDQGAVSGTTSQFGNYVFLGSPGGGDQCIVAGALLSSIQIQIFSVTPDGKYVPVPFQVGTNPPTQAFQSATLAAGTGSVITFNNGNNGQFVVVQTGGTGQGNFTSLGFQQSGPTLTLSPSSETSTGFLPPRKPNQMPGLPPANGPKLGPLEKDPPFIPGGGVGEAANYSPYTLAILGLLLNNINKLGIVNLAGASPPSQSIQTRMGTGFAGYPGFTYTDGTISVAQTGTGPAPSYTQALDAGDDSTQVLGNWEWSSSDEQYFAQLGAYQGDEEGASDWEIFSGPDAVDNGIGNIGSFGDEPFIASDLIIINSTSKGTALGDGTIIEIGYGVASDTAAFAIRFQGTQIVLTNLAVGITVPDSKQVLNVGGLDEPYNGFVSFFNPNANGQPGDVVSYNPPTVSGAWSSGTPGTALENLNGQLIRINERTNYLGLGDGMYPV